MANGYSWVVLCRYWTGKDQNYQPTDVHSRMQGEGIKFLIPRPARDREEVLKIHLFVMFGRGDDFHPFGQ